MESREDAKVAPMGNLPRRKVPLRGTGHRRNDPDKHNEYLQRQVSSAVGASQNKILSDFADSMRSMMKNFQADMKAMREKVCDLEVPSAHRREPSRQTNERPDDRC